MDIYAENLKRMDQMSSEQLVEFEIKNTVYISIAENEILRWESNKRSL